LELLIVGDGPLRRELPATPGVHFAGKAPPGRVAELMLAARALVFPSVWYEGQPMVLLEALAAGLPLVVSDIGGLPETAGQDAILATPGDASSWARGLSRLTDDGWVDAVSARSRATFEARFTPEVALNSLETIYQTVVARE